MYNLKPREEIQESLKELAEKFNYYLYKKGHKIIKKKEASKIRIKYNLTKNISDIEFGILEGNLYATSIIDLHYDTYPNEQRIPWLQNLASIHSAKLQYFIYIVSMTNPKVTDLIEAEFKKELLNMENAEAVKALFYEEVSSWSFTPYELGNLRGFVEATNRAIGKKWEFSEDTYNFGESEFVDWEYFYQYIDSQSKKLKYQNIENQYIAFQMALGGVRFDKKMCE